VRFVDTSYWVALRLRRDANHDVAVRLWAPGQSILTTNQVVGETWTFLRRRDGHQSAVAFLDAVESTDWLTVVHVDEGTEREARAWLRRHDERVYSFVDATSFVVMRRERLREALAFDGDFSAAGLVEGSALRSLAASWRQTPHGLRRGRQIPTAARLSRELVLATEFGTWLHVDGAYGLFGRLDERTAPRLQPRPVGTVARCGGVGRRARDRGGRDAAACAATQRLRTAVGRTRGGR